MLKDRIPPHNNEAEMATLGALLLDQNTITDVLQYLRAGDFYTTSNQKIYQAILDLYDKNSPLDIITITDELKSKEIFKTITIIILITICIMQLFIILF